MLPHPQHRQQLVKLIVVFGLTAGSSWRGYDTQLMGRWLHAAAAKPRVTAHADRLLSVEGGARPGGAGRSCSPLIRNWLGGSRLLRAVPSLGRPADTGAGKVRKVHRSDGESSNNRSRSGGGGEVSERMVA